LDMKRLPRFLFVLSSRCACVDTFCDRVDGVTLNWSAREQ
jgi:hypothetical protein